MPHIDTSPPGSFCWVEVATPDPDATKQFYGSLFGWESVDIPMGSSGVYTMFKLEDRNAAACFRLSPDEKVPPHWGIYLAVENADQSTARARELGGTVIEGPLDISVAGRMAVIQDPAGAVFHVFQPGMHHGLGIVNQNGAFCWADLSTPDPQGARKFYEALFGWQIAPGKDKPADSYLHIQNNGDYIGGIPPAAGRNQHAPPHWMVYFLVADCDASTNQAKELGARVYVPPMSIENNLRFSVVADPQGAVFALFTGQ